LPNDWNIFDMHESVTEWTIWAASADPRIIWERLQARGNVEGYENTFLSGGSFKDSYFGAGSLSRFAFWGGRKLTDGNQGRFHIQQTLWMTRRRVFVLSWTDCYRRIGCTSSEKE